jgi:hypothetical protein
MVSITLTGYIVSDIAFSTTGSGAKRATFIVECPEESSLPLHFYVACFGKKANEAETLVRGTGLLISGRMTAGPKTKKVSLSVSHWEVLSVPAPAEEGVAIEQIG